MSFVGSVEAVFRATKIAVVSNRFDLVYIGLDIFHSCCRSVFQLTLVAQDPLADALE